MLCLPPSWARPPSPRAEPPYPETQPPHPESWHSICETHSDCSRIYFPSSQSRIQTLLYPRSSTHLGTCPIPSSIQKPSWLPQLQEPGPLRRGIFTPLMLEGFSSGLRAELQGPGPQVLTPNAPRAEWEGSEHEGIPGLGARKHPRRRELAWTA